MGMGIAIDAAKACGRVEAICEPDVGVTFQTFVALEAIRQPRLALIAGRSSQRGGGKGFDAQAAAPHLRAASGQRGFGDASAGSDG